MKAASGAQSVGLRLAALRVPVSGTPAPARRDDPGADAFAQRGSARSRRGRSCRLRLAPGNPLRALRRPPASLSPPSLRGAGCGGDAGLAWPAAETTRSNEALVVTMLEELRLRRVIVPGPTTVERACADASVAAERRITERIADRLDADARERLGRMLSEATEDGTSRFVLRLRRHEPGGNSADANRLLAPAEWVSGLAVSEDVISGIPPQRVARPRRQGERNSRRRVARTARGAAAGDSRRLRRPVGRRHRRRGGRDPSAHHRPHLSRCRAPVYGQRRRASQPGRHDAAHLRPREQRDGPRPCGGRGRLGHRRPDGRVGRARASRRDRRGPHRRNPGGSARPSGFWTCGACARGPATRRACLTRWNCRAGERPHRS